MKENKLNNSLELVKNHPLIIAEIGANYGGIETVEKMIHSAKESGADMVKFQTYKAETISTKGCFFEFENGEKISQYEFFKKNELTEKDHYRIDSVCKSLDIPWISTPSHKTDLELLENFNLPFYKTGSDDLTNLQFLKAIASKKRPMLVSTGISTLGEIEAAVEAIVSQGNNQIVLLHCVVSYPSRVEDANLNMITTLQNAFGFPVGLSDHTTNEFTSVLATQIGAVVIEKHFTLSHALKLPDHQASLDPKQFSELVKSVRMVPKAMGDGVKKIRGEEIVWRSAARKSLIAATHIRIGDTIKEEDIEVRRPGNGMHPNLLPLILGKRALVDIEAGTFIDLSMF